MLTRLAKAATHLLALAATAASMLALGTAPGWSQAKEPVRIGAVLSVTGGAAALGDSQMKTLQLYVDEINKSGGVGGRPIEFFAYDDESNASKADRLGKRLISNDNVIAIIGGSTTGATMVMAPLAQEANVPIFSLAGGSVIVNPIRSYVFVMGTSDSSNIERIYQYMKGHEIKKIGILAGTDGYGISASKQAQNFSGQYDIEILAQESFNPKDTDMTAQLTKLRLLPVQAILNLGFGQSAAIIARNYKQLAITLPHFATQAMASDAVIKAAGNATEGMLIAANPGFFGLLPASNPRKALAEDFLTKYRAKYSETPNAPAGYALDALRFIKAAVEKNDSTDPKRLRDEIEKIDGVGGIGGIFRFSADKHVGLDPSALGMLTVKSGGTWALLD